MNSSNDEEFVSLENLGKKINFVDKDHDIIINDPVYQVQGIHKTRKAYIMEVGKFNNPPEILINKFDISLKERCIITSSIFSLDDLKSLETKCSFPMIKIIVNYNNGRVLNPVGSIMLFFHTYEHIRNSVSIIDHLSTSDTKKELDGYFSISFHFKEKKIALENLKEFIGISKLIDKMIGHLASPKIRNIVDNLLI